MYTSFDLIESTLEKGYERFIQELEIWHPTETRRVVWRNGVDSNYQSPLLASIGNRYVKDTLWKHWRILFLIKVQCPESFFCSPSQGTLLENLSILLQF